MECRFCGRLTTLLIGGMPVCEECYENAGSCCLEFGGDDFWQKRQDEPKDGQSNAADGDAGGKQVVPGKRS